MGNAAYYCTARIRFDEIKAVPVNDESAIDIRVQLRVNGVLDLKNGMQVLEGNGALPSLAHSLIHSLTQSLAPSLTHSLAHSLTHSLTHILDATA